MENQIKIIIADDHPLMIDGIKNALTDCNEIEIIGEAKNGLEAIELVKTKKPDLALLDIRMPELDGIDAAKILKKQFSKLKIIILSQYGERGFIRRCQKIGIDGYLIKGCSSKELISTIKNIHNGGYYFNVPDTSIDEYYPANKKATELKISSKELEFLILLAKDYSTDQIAELLKIELSTIKTYKKRLKQKSGTDTLTGLVAWAYQNKII